MKNKIILIVFAFFATILMTACEPETFDNFGGISGTVIDLATGEPINKVLITLSPTSKHAYTGTDGKFEFDELEAGLYVVSAKSDDYHADRANANVVVGKTEIVNFTMTKK